MARIPIIKVGSNLIATVDEDLTDDDALEFQEALNTRLEKVGATGVLIDVTLVETIDSFLGRLLHEIAACRQALHERPCLHQVFQHRCAGLGIERLEHRQPFQRDEFRRRLARKGALRLRA